MLNSLLFLLVVAQLAVQSDALFQKLFPSSTKLTTKKMVAVTGSSGLLGTRLVAELSEKGYLVKKISTTSSNDGDDVVFWNPSCINFTSLKLFKYLP